MYESFYGFKEKPFDLHPDPDYLYMSRVHEDTYVHLEYAIVENKGFVVVTGEIGSGKTTLINYLLNKIGEDIQVALVNNTNILPAEFLKMVCQEFELNPKTNDKADLIDILSGFLIDQFGEMSEKRVKREMTLDEMAAHIGTTREVVCRILHRFSNQGLIDITRTEFTFTDRERLAQLAQNEHMDSGV